MMAEDNSTQVVRLLGNMMNAHSDVVLKSTEELTNLYTDPESTVQLCSVLGNASKLPAMRKCAGHILNNRLARPGDWQKMLPGKQQDAQEALLAALKSLGRDDDESLQLAIVSAVGIVMGLELEAKKEASAWNESVFDYVEQLCVSQDKSEQLLGAIFFKLLVKSSPKMFENNLLRAQSIFVRSLNQAEAMAALVTPATEHLLTGWGVAIPLFRKRSDEHDALSATLPLIMRMTRAFAYQPNPRRSCHGFDVLAKLNKQLPELVWPHLKLLVEDLCQLAADTNLGDQIRVQSIIALRNYVRCKRRLIIRLKMMDKLLMTLYGLMAVKPALDANGEELYLGETQEANTPLTEATQTVLFIAAQSDTNRVAERALRLMQPQLEQHQSAVQRVACHLFLALMAKGFTDLLGDSPLRSFVAALERGFYDVELMVRRAAHFALAIMAENLQPEITVLAPQLMPLFSEFFDQLTPEQRLSSTELESQTRMFCTLEIYTESLRREALQPHLGDLMKRLLATAQPTSNSVSLRQLSLSAIACLSKTTRELFLPHFDAVLAVTLPLVQHAPDEDHILLRSNAIQVINTLSSVSAEKFAACAPQLLDCFLEMVQQVSGVQVFTYELLAVLVAHIPAQINEHISQIMTSIFAAIKEGTEDDKDSDDDDDDDDDDDNKDEDDDENETEVDVEADVEACVDASACTEDDSIGDGHGDQTDNESNTHSVSSTESISSAAGHDEAILCLKALAVHLPDAVEPYLPEAVRRVTACTESRNELGKRAAYEALTEFAVLQHRKGDAADAQLQCRELLPELIEFVESSKETANVIAAMNCITKFLRLLKTDALNGEGLADMVFNVVRRTLRRKLSCQFNIGHDMKMDVLEQWSQALHAETQVMAAVGQLLPAFGMAMRKRQFASYFHKISERFLKSLRQCLPTGQVTPHLFFLYGLVYSCMEPLGVVSERYYDVLCYSVVDCMLSAQPHVRQLAFEVGHWLLTQAFNNDNAQVIIRAISGVFIDALDPNANSNSNANANATRSLTIAEREQTCGILARMLLPKTDCLPVAKLVPALCGNLPLQQHLAAYAHLLPALRQLHQQQPALLQPHLGQLLLALQQALQLPSEETRQAAADLIGLLEAEQRALHGEIS